MNVIVLRRPVMIVTILCGMLALSVPASAQIELTGSYEPLMYEDYIERGPGSDLGDFTGMPLNDDARAKALLYTSSLPSTIERQCLAQAPWVGLYRPLGLRIFSEVDRNNRVIAWKLEGTRTYHDLTRRSLATMQEVAPLRALEADRPRLQAPDVKTLIATRRG